MIDQALAIARFSADEPPRLLYGQTPEGMSIGDLSAMCEAKITMRKVKDALAFMVPGPSGIWIGWIFAEVPQITELPALQEKVKLGSARFLSVDRPPAQVLGEGSVVNVLVSRLAGAKRLKKSDLLKLVSETCVEVGLCTHSAIAWCGLAGTSQLLVSSLDMQPNIDELKYLIDGSRADDPVAKTFSSKDFAAEGLDTTLVAGAFGQAEILVDLPAKGSDGIAYLMFGPTPRAATQIGGITDFIHLMTRGRTGLSGWKRSIVKRAGFALALVLLAAFLVTPAPLRIGATATSQAASSVVSALPFDAFLEQAMVDVGAVVKVGDLLAVFRSPSLEERLTEAKLRMSIEEISAQAALSDDDYGAFVLAEQRVEINKREVEQIEQRLAELEVKATTSGTVISSLDKSKTGRFVQTGNEIATIQPDDKFTVLLTVSKVDAALINVGQTGEVYFRGLAGDTYAFTLLTPAFVQKNPNSGDESLVALARIERGGSGQLFVGLAGFAKIDAGRDLRFKVLGRYVFEFIKVKAWSYLGLHF